MNLLKEKQDEEVLEVLKDLKPMQWRNKVVRVVCSEPCPLGEKLRQLWVKIYRGDLRAGVRDARILAKANNWPSRSISSRKDRNSWISFHLKRSIESLKLSSTKLSSET